MRPDFTIVVDLGFGDAGKGTVVDHLCRVAAAAGRPVGAVVRFNGGAQAAHNVVTDDGRHHTFAQFGAGTLAGVPTHLSRYMLVDPLALAAEAEHLAAIGVPSPFAALTVHGDALLTTPYHAAANRARELARGSGRHGSCGMGIGETAAYALAYPDDAPRVRDCVHPARLRRLLGELRALLESELGPLPAPPVEDCVEVFGEFARTVRLVDDRHVAELLRAGPVVFEGAQGVLLDEWHGFHPFTTWSTTTFANAEKLLRDAGVDDGDVTRLGVLRTFTTRHGAGPLVSEDAALTAALPDRYNGVGRWQGALRAGHFDAVAHRYAVEVAGGVDAVALTHLDAPARHPLRVCGAYDVADTTPGSGRFSDCADVGAMPIHQPDDMDLVDSSAGADTRDAAGMSCLGAAARRIDRLIPGPAGDLDRSAALTRQLSRARPVLDETSPGPDEWPDLVAEVCNAPVSVRSYGPRSGDKH
ncbi:adenylosuccinate synthetase [Pseudofrankia sp. BMG5.36]|uniref:adenylosuccinate synthetase n=1 Tax=Pseudofrankia sp. BMG5.36 TaxID=1834512 RepID=UPI0008D938C3|nr:adenylosuccinate synthetase [Pseudofrankia sp. BMG5.36]OHV59327.1 adenylosuccinate synthetase [Pseudofrankia sp. BMG5.36]